MNKTGFLIIILILLTPIVLAEVDINKAHQWLTSERNEDGSYDSKIRETSTSILALLDANLKSDAQESIDWLINQKDKDGCFPATKCTVKDTAYALIALDKAGKDTEDIVSWLKSVQKPATSSGKWWLQVVTDDDGTCTLKYIDTNGKEQEQGIQIKDQKFVQCNNNNWFDLKECTKGKPLRKQPTVEFSIDCEELTSPIISLIYQSGSNYYLLEESRTLSAKITPDTGCWATAKTGGCNRDSTLYASWALKEVEDTTPAITWLRDNYKSADSNHNSLMLLITGKKTYLDALESSQRKAGDWQGSVSRTALAALAITESNKLPESATDWLASKQKTDGSWNSNIYETSLTLYSAFSGFTPTCGDNICRSEDNEDKDTCPRDCAPSTTAKFRGDDDEDIEVCDDFIDNDDDGNIDCRDLDCFGDIACEEDEELEICDDLIDNDDDGFTDCEDLDCETNSACTTGVTITDGDKDVDDEGGLGALFWIIIIVIILIIIGLIFYAKKKGLFKKRRKTERPLPIPPLSLPKRPAARPTRRIARKKPKEDPLEKSIKEARKLMGLK